MSADRIKSKSKSKSKNYDSRTESWKPTKYLTQTGKAHIVSKSNIQ